MRRPNSQYDLILVFLGTLVKVLFIGMFCSTVLVVLAGIFGLSAPALLIYEIIWDFFWRMCLSLVAIIAMISMLSSLQ